MAQSPQTSEDLVVRAIATLKAKQAALDHMGIGGLTSCVPGFIIWLEDSLREFDEQRGSKTN